ncbi:MAG TPA: hypothetical protein VHG52_12310, partial [Thermomicrobiales bacterium]|nr:hypothetical protein [Thermomicrobiales bacterium]
AGNYSKQRDVSWERADTVVWLDLPLRTSLRRCIGRTWRRYRTREMLWNGNYENFWENLMLWNPKRSLFSYSVTRHRSRRRAFLQWMDDPRWAHITFIHLRSPEEVERWFAEVASATPTPGLTTADRAG